MRAPVRTQDLILTHRVKDYRVGELKRRYPRLAIEEAITQAAFPSPDLVQV